jgi:hypothetical protein
MATAGDMSDDKNWAGGFYELSLVLGAAEDRRLDRAVRSLWRAAGIQKCRVGGALARVDRRIGGYPFDQRSGVESLTWRAPLDRWLADVAVAVHADVPFQRALIGFEIDEDADITADQRWAAVLLPDPEGMDYRPATA